MPSNAWTPLANLTLASPQSSVSFSSISQNFKDLVLIVDGGAPSGQISDLFLGFNGTTGSYSMVRAYGTGSGVGSSTNGGSAGTIYATFGNRIINIMDYSATDKHKTWITRDNNPANNVFMIVATWQSTAAVTSFSIYGDSANFATGTTFALYGVSA